MDVSLKVREEGLYCPIGDFWIDAWGPSRTCVVTHAHGDHAYAGHSLYIGTPETIRIIRQRLGQDIPCQILEYHQKIKLGDCWVSLHPAGHILGSSQVRIEGNNVTVISGDYKRIPDSTCQPFEVVECDVFVTESTFGLPIYKWAENAVVEQQIYDWWQENASEGHPSILFCYALGKAQRILSMLAKREKKIYLHGAIHAVSKVYEEMGVELAPFGYVSESAKGTSFKEDLILAPPSAMRSLWMKRFLLCRTGFASGWMEVRGNRRREALDRGFVLSDHADWNDLIRTIAETKAKTILTMHGSSAILAKYLREVKGIDARELRGLEANIEGED